MCAGAVPEILRRRSIDLPRRERERESAASLLLFSQERERRTDINCFLERIGRPAEELRIIRDDVDRVGFSRSLYYIHSSQNPGAPGPFLASAGSSKYLTPSFFPSRLCLVLLHGDWRLERLVSLAVGKQGCFLGVSRT